MVGSDTTSPSRSMWLLSQPWLWILAGLALSGLGFLWVRLFEDQASLFRLFLITLAVVCAGIAMTVAMNSKKTSFDQLSPARRASFLTLLQIVNGGLALAACVLVFGSLLEAGMFAEVAGSFMLALLVIPISGTVAYRCYRCQTQRTALPKAVEVAALLVLASLCAFVCAWVLFLGPERADEWDTMRLFFATLALVALLAAPVVMLPKTPQRIVISLLILLHFGGILTAVMSAPPVPWVFQQVWARFYKPYLQFMYLNNAYHFYAPEPGPSSFMWFRIEYENEKGEKYSRWVTFPKINPVDGLPDYNMSLRYQRRIGATDQVQHTDPAPPELVTDEDGNIDYNPIYYWRFAFSDVPMDRSLGRTAYKDPEFKIPFQRNIAPVNQYKKPNLYSRKLIKSYAYHFFTEDYKGLTPLRVKVYRVVHVVASDRMIALGVDPNNPVLFQPFYQGEFGLDKKGNFQLLDEPKFDDEGNLIAGDPMLYWLIPILPEDPDPTRLNKTIIRGYVYRHADDRRWIWYPGDDAPQEPRP